MRDAATVIDLLSARLSQRFPLELIDRDALLALRPSTRRLEAGQYLVREGDRPRQCALLVHGFAYRHKFVGDGGRQILGINVRGDFIDLQNLLLEESDHNIQALTPVEVAQYDIDPLLDLCFARPTIGRAVWREALAEGSIFREWVANVGRRSARARTSHLLCEMALRNENAGLGERTSFELPMTQEQLGDALGLTAVHVNRTLKVLQDDGLIARSKRAVTITDWGALSQVADFTSGYLHLAG